MTGTRCLLLNCKKMANDETVNPYGKLSRFLLLWALNGARLPWGGKGNPSEPPGSSNSKQKGGVRTAGPGTPGAVCTSLLRACVNSSKSGKKSTLLP